MDTNLNTSIIEKVVIKKAAIYKAIAMLPPPPFEDKFAKETICQTEKNIQKTNSEKCLNETERKTEEHQSDTMNETKIVNELENLNITTQTKSGIYKIINKIDGKYYVGSSSNFKKRWKQHLITLRSHKHHNDFLQRSWDKYGEQNFIFEIVEYVDETKLLIVEQKYLDIAKQEQNKSYNLNWEASGGNISEYSRLKLKNRYFSPEHRKKISESKIGKKRSEETIEKLKLSRIGKKNTPESNEKRRVKMLGKTLSEESKLKLSHSRKGMKFSDEHKKNISLNNASRDLKIYKFYNKITKEECCLNRLDFVNKYGGTDIKKFKWGINVIVRGYNKLNKQWAYKGWIVLNLIQQMS
jgi:group I intron endonuclease